MGSWVKMPTDDVFHSVANERKTAANAKVKFSALGIDDDEEL